MKFIGFSYTDIVTAACNKRYKAACYYGYGRYEYGQPIAGEAKNKKTAELTACLTALQALTRPCIIQMHCSDYVHDVITGMKNENKTLRDKIITTLKQGNHKIIAWNDQRSNLGNNAAKNGITFYQIDKEGRIMTANGKPMTLGHLKPEQCEPWKTDNEKLYAAVKFTPVARAKRGLISK